MAVPKGVGSNYIFPDIECGISSSSVSCGKRGRRTIKLKSNGLIEGKRMRNETGRKRKSLKRKVENDFKSQSSNTCHDLSNPYRKHYNAPRKIRQQWKSSVKITPQKCNKNPKGLVPLKVMPSRTAKMKIISYSATNAKSSIYNRINNESDAKDNSYRQSTHILTIKNKVSPHYNSEYCLNGSSERNKMCDNFINTVQESSLNDESSSSAFNKSSVSCSDVQESSSPDHYGSLISTSQSSVSSLPHGVKFIQIEEDGSKTALEQVKKCNSNITVTGCTYIPKQDTHNTTLPIWFSDFMLEHRRAQIKRVEMLLNMEKERYELQQIKLRILQESV